MKTPFHTAFEIPQPVAGTSVVETMAPPTAKATGKRLMVDFSQHHHLI